MQGDAAHMSATLARCCASLYLHTPPFSLWKVPLPSAKSDLSNECIQNQEGLLSVQSFPYKLPVKCRVLYFLNAIMFYPVHWLSVCASEISSGVPEQKAS